MIKDSLHSDDIKRKDYLTEQRRFDPNFSKDNLYLCFF